jgi:hypothetical protein
MNSSGKSWQTIESQADLNALDKRVCWEDSGTVEYYASTKNEKYFPSDVSRSGYANKNIHVLCRICSNEAAYLEMVWVDCDWFTCRFLDCPHMSGRVDTLKRVEVLDAKRSTMMRCSRLIYRFLQEADVAEGSFYVQSEVENEV